jgi:aryl-alcohol dehydrogenase-like predicted oxidoreductase
MPWQEIGVIPYYPLAAGFLSGKYRSAADLGKSRRGASDTVKKHLNERGLSVLKALDAAARSTTRATPPWPLPDCSTASRSPRRL